MCETYNLDGIDIDWEYPVGGNNPENFITLLTELKSAFKAQEPPLNISIATAAGPDNYMPLDWSVITTLVDRINLMTYDYHGPWGGTNDAVTNHQSPLYQTEQGPLAFNISRTLEAYKTLGADLSKISIGLPLYDRTYAGVTGGENGSHLYSPYTGPGTGYSTGIKYWRQVQDDIQSGAAIGYWDDQAKAFSAYYPESQEFATGVDAQSIQTVVDFGNQQNVQGYFVWEFKGDDDNCSAIHAISTAAGAAMKFSGKEAPLERPELSFKDKEIAPLKKGEAVAKLTPEQKAIAKKISETMNREKEQRASIARARLAKMNNLKLT